MIKLPIRSVMSNIRWKRGAEDLYRQNLESTLPWGEWDRDVDGDLLSGFVVTQGDSGRVERANGGRFRGIIFNEVSKDIDEALYHTHAGVITGPGRVKVLRQALDPNATYEERQILTSADGYLAPAAVDGTSGEVTTAAEAQVGMVAEVLSHAIVVLLFEPTG